MVKKSEKLSGALIELADILWSVCPCMWMQPASFDKFGSRACGLIATAESKLVRLAAKVAP